MVRIKPFRALRPTPETVEGVACVPYDVVDRDEAAALAEGLPNSLLRVDRAEIELPEGIDPHRHEVYARAAANLKRMESEGALVREATPSLYVYRQTMGDHRQIGVAAVCHVDDYEAGVIRRHENTRPDKETDRAKLIDALSAQTGPVFLAYRGRPEIDAAIAAAVPGAPLFDIVAPDGIGHTLWRVDGGGGLDRMFADVPVAYVADGHHRSAAALRVARWRRERAGAGEFDSDWFLAVLFPSEQLRILPYHRVVADLGGLGEASFLERVGTACEGMGEGTPEPAGAGNVSMYLGGKWYALRFEPGASDGPVARLDVAMLQDRLLGPVLGIDDPRVSSRIAFVGGIRGPEALVNAVDSGRMAVAFSMFPTGIDQLLEVADAGLLMPPKSTWFEPKLRSGLVIHAFEADGV
jgi:uncharacterized protein (DUF1015 family)